MADYSEQIATTIELITLYGGMGALIVPGGTSADPDKDWIATAEQDTATPAPVLVMLGKAYVAMGGLTVRPSQGWLVRDPGGGLWAIAKEPDIIDPSGNTPIVAICEVARWPVS